MDVLRKKVNRFPLGIWMALFALGLICLAWLMQAYSLYDWEGAVNIGVQERSFLGDDIDREIADIERGIAIADLIWALPLTLIAFFGLIQKRLFGFIAGMMIFAICVYFPLFYAFRENMNIEIRVIAILVWAFPSFLGIIGLWVNKSLFKIN
jgi:hypothetical protein